MAHKIKMPSTETPEGVSLLNLLILCGSLLVLVIFLGFIGFGLWLIVSGLTLNNFFRPVPGFHGLIVMNTITGRQRTLFQGKWNNWVLPWEVPETDENGGFKYRDLRVEFHEVVNHTCPTSGAVLVVVYNYKMRINIDYNAGENVILHGSFEPAAIKQTGRGLFSRKISDYFRNKKIKQLPDKELTTAQLFGDDGRHIPQPGDILSFEDEHGVIVEINIEDIDFEASVQKYRDLLAGAQSIREAMDVLTADDKMDRDEAVRILKLANFDGFTQSEYTLQANGLENLNTIITGGLPGGNVSKKNKP